MPANPPPKEPCSPHGWMISFRRVSSPHNSLEWTGNNHHNHEQYNLSEVRILKLDFKAPKSRGLFSRFLVG